MSISCVYLAAACFGAVLCVIGGIAFYALYRLPGKYLDVDGGRLFYREEGSGEPVILIHGYGINGDLNWRHSGVARALRKAGYRVILPDVRGHGRSAKPHDAEQYGAELLEDVIRLLDHLAIEKAHIVGYSMGGFIVIKLSQTFPNRMLSAVACASGFERPEGDRLEVLLQLIETLDESQSYKPLLLFLEPGAPRKWKIGFVNFFMRWMNDTKALCALMKSFRDLAVTEDELRNNQVPMLSIVGSRDPLGRGVEEMLEMMPRYEAVYVDGGDHLTTMFSQQFKEALISFLGKRVGGVVDT
ncbi:MAG: alpha/beta hydrolase [Candidatus Hydrogenedentales bacterium]|jgi:pimeloyl-ACP methyl ester carboxylesterase